MRKIKILTALVGCLVFTTMNPIFASTNQLPENVRLLGTTDGMLSFQGDEPFLMKHGMMPGDRVEQLLIIHNDHDYASELFLRAERVSEAEEFDLLSKLELTIYHKEGIIYKGPACGSGGLNENISLGVYKPGEADVLYAAVELDGPSTSNDYLGKEAEVNWIFTATHVEEDENKTENHPEDNATESLDPSLPTKPSSPTTGYAMSGIALVVAAGCIGVGVRNYVKEGKGKRSK